MNDLHASHAKGEVWPALPYAEWRETLATLHLWTQIVGKIRLATSPMINHWWQVPLYVTARGLTTSPLFYEARLFQIDFDFLSRQLMIQTGDGALRALPLAPRSVADFYRDMMNSLQSLGIQVPIWPMPVEIANPVRCDQDHLHAAYNPEHAQNFWRILAQSYRVLTDFRADFTGKASPIHFFWGSFDLAATRFSGRSAPPHPGTPGVPNRITRPAYSHEVSSAGFWPGGAGLEEPVFYAYAYPAPIGFHEYPIKPQAAYFSVEFGEFILPYEAVRTASDPDAMLLSFLQSTYEAAATLGRWDRKSCEDRTALQYSGA